MLKLLSKLIDQWYEQVIERAEANMRNGFQYRSIRKCMCHLVHLAESMNCF